ncbi:MAG: hypothetical protein MZW92_79645 [Comamonadaceae bacterium]|nr:hypothetical protein [Comamonadaceae bacterium]
MRELLQQMGERALRGQGRCSTIRRRRILDIDREVAGILRDDELPDANFGVAAGRQPDPLDRQGPRQRPEPRGVEGQRRDQQDPRPRGAAQPIPVDGICVRVGAMRCHSQALTIKLKRDVPLAEIERHDRRRQRLGAGGARTRARPRSRELTPAAVTGTLDDPGRPPAQARDGRRVPGGLHRRRPVAVGRGRAAAPHAAHPARRAADRRRPSFLKPCRDRPLTAHCVRTVSALCLPCRGTSRDIVWRARHNSIALPGTDPDNKWVQLARANCMMLV